AAQQRRNRVFGSQVGAAAALAAKARAGNALAAAALPAAACLSGGAASLAHGDARLGHDARHLLLELFTFFGRSGLHLLAQIGHLLAVLVGEIGEAAASA